MSLDFTPSGSHHASAGLYGQPALDHGINSMHGTEAVVAPSVHNQHHHLGGNSHPHAFDQHSEGVDVSEHHGGYDLFPHSPQSPSFTPQRYRSNAGPSSSITPGYSISHEPIYPHSSFGESVPSFNGAGSYNVLQGGMPSSYSGSKNSPLTPNDPVHSYPPPLATNKEYPQSGYADLLADRRITTLSGGNYPSQFHDEYGVNGVNNGIPFSPTATQYQERIPRFQADARFPHSPTVPSTMHQELHHAHHSDALRGVQPQATHAYRSDGSMQGYDEIPQFMNSNSHPDLTLRMPSVDETLARLKLQSHPSPTSAGDLQSFIRPYLDQYIRTSNRLAFGERTVIVMSSKVAQKSYGTEKRFLCPPPTAIMIGSSWWSDTLRHGEEPKISPPRVVISISGEPMPHEGSVDWTTSSGKSFDLGDPPPGTTYIGRCVGKQLFISDVDEKKKKVEALVKISAPVSNGELEGVIGVFPSRPIKVISKPSKKRQSAKNLELCINHGSTICLFHRLRAQTVSTKYLCVSGSGSSFKGSDGAPLMGLDHRNRSTTPSFIARTASWDPFIMYIVDVNKPTGGLDAPTPPAPLSDYPSPPPNAIPFTNNGSQIPIYYNQTVVLQCLTSGVVSPVLIIRKVDHQTTVVGGGLQEGARGVAEHYCSPGEVCGDPVSQLHKVAFEVYDPSRGFPEPGTPGVSGAFLSCMGEKVNTYRPIEGRQWNTTGPANGSASPEPVSPIGFTPTSSAAASLSGGNSDYFGTGGLVESAPGSPSSTVPPTEFLSNDGGRVKKKRSSSSAGGIAKTPPTKGRRRQNSAASTGSSRRGSSGELGASSGALWQVDIGETSVWTIVGTDQVRYNFYVPPILFDHQAASHAGSFPVPSKPVTPFPGVVKYLPPDRAAEAPKSNCASSRALLAKPNPHASKMLTIYGENFAKTDPIHVFFGADPSPYVEVRCTEVVGCLPPDAQTGKRRPIVLVRSDGVVFPSNTLYP